MRHSHHSGIIRLFAVYEDSNFVYLIQELCKGGELLDHILKAKYFDEREAAAIMLKLTQILAYLHANQVADNLKLFIMFLVSRLSTEISNHPTSCSSGRTAKTQKIFVLLILALQNCCAPKMAYS